jgi:hypothetical protein
MKFRKKPIVIEAAQFTEDLAKSMLIDKEPGPFGLTACGDYHPANRTVSSAWISIRTLRKGSTRRPIDCVMTAHLGDWIIKGIQGECYPCKPDIFAATYEPVGEEQET